MQYLKDAILSKTRNLIIRRKRTLLYFDSGHTRRFKRDESALGYYIIERSLVFGLHNLITSPRFPPNKN